MAAQIHDIDEARHRPVIDVQAGELPRVVKEGEAALISGGAGIFQRAGQLVRIVRLENDGVEQGVRRPAGSTIIMPVSREYLSLALARSADWKRYDRRIKAMRPIDPPSAVAGTLMSAVGEWDLPVLTGIVAAPTLRADGSLLNAPGYDAASGLYAAFAPADFPAISSKPNGLEAIDALELLDELFSECEFTGGSKSAHATVAIAATITAAVRHALPTAPAFGIGAHKQGSGKTTAANAISHVCTGRKPPVLALSDDESELRKTLLAILIAGDAVVLIDNVAKPVDSAALCALLTSPTYSDRVLGLNQRVVAPTASTWIFTGNHLEFVGDLTTRVLLSVLDPEVEHPEARPFKRDLAEYVAEHRGDLLAAALTIPLAYLAAGEPDVAAAASRFREWDRFVRRPLLWLHAADPLDTQALVQAADPVRESLLGVLRAWREVFQDEAASVARAVQAAAVEGHSERPQLLEALQAVAGDRGEGINARRLGRYLKRNVRRIEGGLRFEFADIDRSTSRQQFRVTCVSSVSANPTREIAAKSEVRSETDAENDGNDGLVCRKCDGEGCQWCQ